MLSHERKFIFVHIPKTGGTSLESALIPFTEAAKAGPEAVLIKRNRNPFKGPPWLQHLTTDEYRKMGYVNSLSDYFVFALVRNPWERLVSEYNSKGLSWRMRWFGVPWTFKNFVLQCLPRWWEDNYLFARDNHRHILPQHRFITADDGKVCVNQILRLETFSEDFAQLKERLGLPTAILPHLKKSENRDPFDGNRMMEKRLHYSRYYTDETKSFVEEYYRKDLDLLGYEFQRDSTVTLGSTSASNRGVFSNSENEQCIQFNDARGGKMGIRQDKGIIQIRGHSIYPQALSKNSVVFDLGANHGEFASAVVKMFGCACVAVEGSSQLSNQFPDNSGIRVIHALVGERDGVSEFSIAENDQCSSILRPLTSKTVATETVKMLSLESLLNLQPAQSIDLVKMDIEGAEVSVLDSCPDWVLTRVAQLTVEFHDSLGMTSRADIYRIAARLKSLGFFWFRGSFSNYEDNLFINEALCPMGVWEIFLNRSWFRFRNGFSRVRSRLWNRG